MKKTNGLFVMDPENLYVNLMIKQATERLAGYDFMYVTLERNKAIDAKERFRVAKISREHEPQLIFIDQILGASQLSEISTVKQRRATILTYNPRFEEGIIPTAVSEYLKL